MADNTNSAAETLVEQGLQLYSQGRLDEAIARWREVIGQVPDHPRARDYIQYVEDNRAALEASFKLTSASSTSLEAAPPEGSAEEEPPAEPEANVEFVVSPAADGSKQDLVQVLEEGDPRRTLPLPGLGPVESTARMDVSDLQHKVDQTKMSAASRLTPAMDSPVVREVERSRRPTPLVLVPGEGKPREDGFEPQENTPVAVGLPQPSRVMTGEVEHEEDEEQDGFGELQKTPVIMLPPDLFEESAPPVRAVGEGAERVESMLTGARQLHDQGTYEGSLWLCKRVLSIDASNDDARELLETNRKVLLEQSRKQIGDLEQVPVIQIPQHEIMWHKLDHRAGFLLSRIDGQLSFEDIIDVSGMGEFEASRILSQLLNLGVIGPRG